MDTTRVIKKPLAQEATRVGRAAPPGRKAVSAKPPPAPRVSTGVSLPLERLALVARVLGRERAAELLEGLGEPDAAQAQAHLSRIVALSSAQRQARVAVEFGVVDDAAERLRALMEEAPEPLRREIFRRLPPYHRSLFPQRTVEPPDAAATPALCTLAERLLREATR
jgi:hypothetical protein